MRSLRGKIAAMVVLVVLMCSLILSFVSYQRASKNLSVQLESSYSISAERYVQELVAWINTNATIIDTMAADIVTEEIVDSSGAKLARAPKAEGGQVRQLLSHKS